MTKEEFRKGYETLSDAFGAPRKKERAEIYWSELMVVSSWVFDRAVKQIIHKGERFPTLATLLGTIQSIQPEKEEKVRVSCRHCIKGAVVYEDRFYRCKCENGTDGYPTLDLAPEAAYEPKKPLLEQIMELKDPVTFFKGFCSTGKLLKAMNPKAYTEVRQYFIDLLGKEEAIRIYEKTEKMDIAVGKV